MNLEIEATESELKFLRWFYYNADFGPADGDVRRYLKAQYIDNHGQLPVGYEDEVDEEEELEMDYNPEENEG